MGWLAVINGALATMGILSGGYSHPLAKHPFFIILSTLFSVSSLGTGIYTLTHLP
jgi:hypothetical protein